ncbi:MAG: hypothetical protein JNL44_18565 [Gemmatimonadetes bacterium]|nr:hypothetical protein [Gemmatimonadota bacterium]
MPLGLAAARRDVLDLCFDATDALAALVKVWPEGVELRPESIAVSERGISVRGEAKGHAETQILADALASPAVVVRDSWHKGIGGIAVPVSNGTETGAIVVPVATSSVTEKEMRGALSAKLLELVGRYQLVRGNGG